MEIKKRILELLFFTYTSHEWKACWAKDQRSQIWLPVWVPFCFSPSVDSNGYFTFSHHLSMVGLSAFRLAVHRLCGFVEGRLSHFLPRWLRTGWQSVISQGKIPWNTPPCLGIEPGPQGGQTVSYSTELSWLTILNGCTRWKKPSHIISPLLWVEQL